MSRDSISTDRVRPTTRPPDSLTDEELSNCLLAIARDPGLPVFVRDITHEAALRFIVSD